jgi:hypothetical protein
MHWLKRGYLTIAVLLVLVTVVGGLTVSAKGKVNEVELLPDDSGTNAEFGRSVAVDGDLVVVGAGAADAGQVNDAGAVFVYRRQGQQYVQEAKLVAPDPSVGAEFGRAVAIKGNSIIVGARFAQVGGLTNAGAAYVFLKEGESWSFEQKITSPVPASEDNFGRAVAVHGDTLVVTARKEAANAPDVGAAYVFGFDGGIWGFQTKLTASDPASGAYFGQSVALHGDLMAIGARNADPNAAGAVYVLRRSASGWGEVDKVTPPGGLKDDHFGFAVDLSGNVMVVGSRRSDSGSSKDTGAAYVYSVVGEGVRFETKLESSDKAAGDQFGQSVAFVGSSIAVGSWKDESGHGAVYMFNRKGGSWVEMDKIVASNGTAGDEFGYSLDGSGNRLVTGAHFAGDAGAAYVIDVLP